MSLATVLVVVLVILAAEAGIVAIAIGAYAVMMSLRRKDPLERLDELERDQLELEGLVVRALKKLSPGRPKSTPDPVEASGALPDASPKELDVHERLQRIRNGMSLGRMAR